MSEGLSGKLHKSTLWFIGAVAATVSGVFICLPLLFKFFIGPNFQTAQQYAYMLTGGYFMWGIYNAFIGYLLYLSKNRQIFYISVSGTIISLSLNSFMVPYYGATGAAITSIITYTFMAAFCFFYVRKYFLLNAGGASA
jgi:O-antigen/teichoic acid export membrane protein